MRIRWHMWWLLALASAACSLNPQPDLPAGPHGDGGAGADLGIGGVSGASDLPVGNSGGLPSGSGGSIAITTPDAGAAEAEAGASGEAGIAGAAGDTPVVR